MVADVKMREYYTNGEVMARAQLIAYEEYRHDAISIFSEVGIIAEAMGSEFDYPDDDLPVLRRPILKYKDIDRIVIPRPKTAKRMPVYLEAIEYVYKALGDTVPVLAYVPAPFTTGMMLSEPNQFLIDTIKKPNYIKQVMEIAFKATIEFCYDIINCGGLPLIVDPLASSSVISPRIYRDFALPYEKELIKFLHRYDFDVILHICGDTVPILDLLPETGADLVSLDKVDINVAIAKLSEKMRIIGNYDTAKIAFSSMDEISRDVKNMVMTAKPARKGYIASTGCEVPVRAPVQNVKAFIKAAKEAGWYWE